MTRDYDEDDEAWLASKRRTSEAAALAADAAWLRNARLTAERNEAAAQEYADTRTY